MKPLTALAEAHLTSDRIPAQTHPQGTTASKKKKKKKLDRVMSTLKRRARRGKAHQQHSFAALQLLHEPQARSVHLCIFLLMHQHLCHGAESCKS